MGSFAFSPLISTTKKTPRDCERSARTASGQLRALGANNEAGVDVRHERYLATRAQLSEGFSGFRDGFGLSVAGTRSVSATVDSGMAVKRAADMSRWTCPPNVPFRAF